MTVDSSKPQIRRAIETVIKRATEDKGMARLHEPTILGPVLRLDLETYRLMRTEVKKWHYSQYFSDAVQVISQNAESHQLEVAGELVRNLRLNGNFQITRTRLRTKELKWVEEKAEELGLEPRRILEAMLYLYVRAVGSVTNQDKEKQAESLG